MLSSPNYGYMDGMKFHLLASLRMRPDRQDHACRQFATKGRNLVALWGCPF